MKPVGHIDERNAYRNYMHAKMRIGFTCTLIFTFFIVLGLLSNILSSQAIDKTLVVALVLFCLLLIGYRYKMKDKI